jgi:SEC-C motif
MGAIADGFVAFAQPLIDQTDGSLEQLKKAFAISQVCFNLALIPDELRNKSLGELRSSLEMDEEEFDDFRRSIVDPMVLRHQEMFPRMHRRDSTDPWRSGPSLQADPRKAAPSDKSPVTDRYAPCPCNSGEKYKFCCGSRRR